MKKSDCDLIVRQLIEVLRAVCGELSEIREDNDLDSVAAEVQAEQTIKDAEDFLMERGR